MPIRAKGFDPTVRCEYHSNTQGHSIENCWTLKRITEKLIDDNTIVILNEEEANVTKNPLPAHANGHVIGMISNDREYTQMGGMITALNPSEEGMSMDTKLIRMAPLIVKGASLGSIPKNSVKLILYVPMKEKEVPMTGPKLYVPSGFPRFGRNKNNLGKPTKADRKWAKEWKKKIWKLPKSIPYISQSFTKPRYETNPNLAIQDDVEKMCQGLSEMFDE
ncbi:hypothetical protein HAX54_049667, partial [Datura stramonium]|nr:hypothetical protein [Datura stramonium]